MMSWRKNEDWQWYTVKACYCAMHCCEQSVALFGVEPCVYVCVGRYSVVGVATRYGLDGPGIESRWGARFSAPVQTGPGNHPASYTMGTGSFPGVKRPGRGVDHPTPSSAEVKERVELYLYSPSGPSWLVLGWIYFTLPCVCLCVCVCVSESAFDHESVGMTRYTQKYKNLYLTKLSFLICDVWQMLCL
jgi:hypothetical protein